MKKLFVWAALMGAAMLACAQQPQSQTAPISALNAKYANGVAPGYAPTARSGFTLNLGAGTANCAGAIAAYAGGTLTMTASATNYVYLDTAASCEPAVKTSAFTPADIPVAEVVADASAITSISDVRTLFVKPGYCPEATDSQIGCVLATEIANSFQMFQPDPLGTQSVLVPFTVATNSGLDTNCLATSNATSGTVTMNGGSNLGCQPDPGPTITWSAATLPSEVPPANVTAIYAVGTVGYTGSSQQLHVNCVDTSSHSTTLMDGGTLDSSPDTDVMQPYSAPLTWATGAGIGNISCAANIAANAGGATNPVIMNIPSILLRVYYTGTAPPASTKLNITSCLYLNSALNALGISAINLAGTGDCGVTGTLKVANGGTNGTTAAAALSNLLGNPAAGNYAINCTSTTSCAPVAGTGAVVQSAHAAGCTTGSSSYSTCPTTVAFPAAFADTSYDVSCTGQGPSDARATINGYTITDSQHVSVATVTEGSVAVSFSEISCIGAHN